MAGSILAGAAPRLRAAAAGPDGRAPQEGEGGLQPGAPVTTAGGRGHGRGPANGGCAPAVRTPAVRAPAEDAPAGRTSGDGAKAGCTQAEGANAGGANTGPADSGRVGTLWDPCQPSDTDHTTCGVAQTQGLHTPARTWAAPRTSGNGGSPAPAPAQSGPPGQARFPWHALAQAERGTSHRREYRTEPCTDHHADHRADHRADRPSQSPR